MQQIVNTEYAKLHVIEGLKTFSNTSRLYGMDLAEFGVKDGQSLRLIEDYAIKNKLSYRTLFGFDSFTGFPAEAPNAPALHDWVPGSNAISELEIPRLHNGKCIKGFYSTLSQQTILDNDIKPFGFINIDCDLYISTIDAFTFLFDNNLIVEESVIAFDEFKSTKELWIGGESMAWKELSEKYKIESTEIFRNIFNNPPPYEQINWWQNTFIINSIGKINQCNLLQ